MTAESLVLCLERELMSRSGIWVADFTESRRNVKVEETVFDVVLTGDTRPKGLVIARIIGFLLVPEYYVATFVLRASNELQFDSIITTVRRHMRYEKLRWSWLVIVGDEKFLNRTRDDVKRLNMQDIGIVVLEASSGRTVSSEGLLGNHLNKCVKKGFKASLDYAPRKFTPGTISPVSVSKLVFSIFSIFLLVYLGITLVTGLFPIILSPAIFLSSVFLGRMLYLRKFHVSFSYDLNSFVLKQANKTVAHGEWSNIRDVSLVRQGIKDFYVSLKTEHKPQDVRVPASSLKVDPFAFRLSLLGLSGKMK
jgi:hypothetical protein